MKVNVTIWETPTSRMIWDNMRNPDAREHKSCKAIDGQTLMDVRGEVRYVGMKKARHRVRGIICFDY